MKGRKVQITYFPLVAWIWNGALVDIFEENKKYFNFIILKDITFLAGI